MVNFKNSDPDQEWIIVMSELDHFILKIFEHCLSRHFELFAAMGQAITFD